MLDDAELSACCKLEFYKDSGPGGQKRNKSSSAARVTLPEYGLTVTDCTERSQHRNRENALRKLRMELALNVRETPAVPPERPDCSMTHREYPLWTARVLDVFFEQDLDHRAAAAVIGISTSALVKKLYRDPVLWQRVNRALASGSRPLLKAPK